MKNGELSRANLRRSLNKSKRRSGLAKKWKGWDDTLVCDNCGRKRVEARIYPKKKIPYWIWEREPFKIHNRQKIEVDICEICLAFIDERGMLP